MVDDRATGGALRRYVSCVLEVAGVGESGRPATNELFTPGPDGRAVPSGTPPSPQLLDVLTRAGFDPGLLDYTAGLWPTHDRWERR
jgi:pilus assembly protein CpaF